MPAQAIKHKKYKADNSIFFTFLIIIINFSYHILCILYVPCKETCNRFKEEPLLSWFSQIPFVPSDNPFAFHFFHSCLTSIICSFISDHGISTTESPNGSWTFSRLLGSSSLRLYDSRKLSIVSKLFAPRFLRRARLFLETKVSW